MANLNVTQQDIADTLHISRTTVSKVLSGKPVTTRVRSAVLSKAVEMGYIDPQSSGDPASMPAREKAAGFLLLLCFQGKESCPGEEAANKWKMLKKGMETGCMFFGYTLIVSILSRFDGSEQILIDQLTQGRFNGIAITGDAEMASTFLQAYSIPAPMVLVGINEYCSSSENNYDVIAFDILGAITEMVKQFADHGNKKVFFIGSVKIDSKPNALRIYFLHACMACDVTADFSLEGIDSAETVIEEINERLSNGEEHPPAFFCGSAQYACKIYRLLQMQGHLAPGEIQLCGLGDWESADESCRFATTVTCRELLGWKAVDQLIWRIKNPKFPRMRILQRLQVINTN